MGRARAGGATWTDIELLEISHFGAPSTTAVHVASLAAGTYSFRVATDESQAQDAFEGDQNWPVFYAVKVRFFAVKA